MTRYFAGVGDVIKGEVTKVETVEEGQSVTISIEDDGARDGEEVTFLLRRPKQPLFSADPSCDHEIELRLGGGYGCTKCPGWYCL